MKAAGEALVAFATKEELATSLPTRLINSGSLGTFVWLVIHHDANQAFLTLTATCLKVRLHAGHLSTAICQCISQCCSNC